MDNSCTSGTVLQRAATGDDVFVMFSGSKNADGVSWCPDCVTAEPVVNKCLESLPDDSHYLYVGVGDRTFWKDQSCIFRKNISRAYNSF